MLRFNNFILKFDQFVELKYDQFLKVDFLVVGDTKKMTINSEDSTVPNLQSSFRRVHRKKDIRKMPHEHFFWTPNLAQL